MRRPARPAKSTFWHAPSAARLLLGALLPTARNPDARSDRQLKQLGRAGIVLGDDAIAK